MNNAVLGKTMGERTQLCLRATRDATRREIRRDDLRDQISTVEESFAENLVAIENSR